MRYRVIVIGAGPGGVILARDLAKQDIEVIVYEKKQYAELGHNWSDAVELMALEAAGLDMPQLINSSWQGPLVKESGSDSGIFEKHAIPRLLIKSPGLKSIKEIDFRMITTDRHRLALFLVKEAEEAGVIFKYGWEGKSLLCRESGSGNLDNLEVYGVNVKNVKSGKVEALKADIVVESSGFQSILRTSLPSYSGLADSFDRSDFALVHREVRTYRTDREIVEFPGDYYRYGYHTGYQWIHYHNEGSIDVGAGVKDEAGNPDPKGLIEQCIAGYPWIEPKMIRGGRSLCIVGKPLMNFVATGFLVIGDAASTSVPTTGCGVGSAVLMGIWAAEVIGEAASLKSNNLEILWNINRKFYIESRRGIYFAALSVLRGMLQTLSHNELDYLFAQNLMNSENLQEAVNGIFKPADSKTKIRALFRGINQPGVMMKLSRAVSRASKLYHHFNHYPPGWDRQKYDKWSKKAKELYDEC